MLFIVRIYSSNSLSVDSIVHFLAQNDNEYRISTSAYISHYNSFPCSEWVRTRETSLLRLSGWSYTSFAVTPACQLTAVQIHFSRSKRLRLRIEFSFSTALLCRTIPGMFHTNSNSFVPKNGGAVLKRVISRAANNMLLPKKTQLITFDVIQVSVVRNNDRRTFTVMKNLQNWRYPGRTPQQQKRTETWHQQKAVLVLRMIIDRNIETSKTAVLRPTSTGIDLIGPTWVSYRPAEKNTAKYKYVLCNTKLSRRP